MRALLPLRGSLRRTLLLWGKGVSWSLQQRLQTSLFATARTMLPRPRTHKFGPTTGRPNSLEYRNKAILSRDAIWNKKFEQFKEFVQEELGHHPKPRLTIKHWSKSDPKRKLALWFKNQRVMYRDAIVFNRPSFAWTENRTNKMESLGLPLELHDSDSFWNKRYDQLCDFIKRRRCLPTEVPQKTLSSNEILLRKWCYYQKKQFEAFGAGRKFVSSNLRCTMTNARAEKLVVVGFVFDPWLLMYDELRDFYEEHGHAHVPAVYPCNPKLATWVRHQREKKHLAKRRETGYKPFTRKQLSLLKKLDFEWDKVDAKWLGFYHQLKAHVAAHGIRTKPRDKFLLQWLKNQKWIYVQFFKGGKTTSAFTKRRASLLEELGYDIFGMAKDSLKNQRKRQVKTTTEGLFGNVEQMKWNDTLNNLLDYYKQNGHFNVPKGKGDSGADLKDWLTVQHKLYQKWRSGDKVPSNTTFRMEKLLAMGYVFPH
jgi:hypothetical protein